MTDNLLTRIPDIEQLFAEHGDCVLYDIFADINVISTIHKKCNDLPDKTCWRINSPSARFIMEKKDLSAFFADGTLFHSEFADRGMLDRFAKIAAKQGIPVRQKIAVEAGLHLVFRDKIGKAAARKYPAETGFTVVPLAPKEEFIQELFSGDNICLTAAASENIASDCRKYLALFSDGRFIVSKNYAPNNGINDHRVAARFMEQYPQYVYFAIEYVPDDYLEAVYQKAREYDWYAVPQSANAPEYRPTEDEFARMRKFYDEKLKDSACISVTAPDERGAFSPQEYHYALFKNGALVIDKTLSSGKKQVLTEELHRLFPELEIYTYRVPPFWIDEIYKALLKVQKSARQIYTEMLKQKARKLKKMLDIPHYEALETVARMAGWNSWKQITEIDEDRARYVISVEKQNKKTAAEFNLDQVEYEYKEYMKKR